MTTDLGAWLRAQREEHGWSRSETGRRLIATARETGDAGLPNAETIRGYIYRWEHGKIRTLSERHALYYCRALGIKPARFGPQPGPAPGATVIQAAAVIPAGAGVPSCQSVAYRGMETPNTGQSTMRREVLMAAHEGSEYAEQAERRDFGDATLEQLHADVVRLSAELMTGDPFSMFLEMRKVRDRVYRLLEGHLRPGDQADLYFLLGCLSDLMAVPASGLGYPQAAEELIRSGWAYAAAIDNRPLMAHLRVQLASIMLWDGQFRRARDLAEDGLRYLGAGPTGVNLYLKCAQAAARTGDADAARHSLAEARGARDHADTDDVAALGGEFGVSAALDAAVAAIEPALSLPPARRINAVMARLQLVRTELAAPVFRGSAQARDLDERIEEFSRDSVAAGLHALPAGPA